MIIETPALRLGALAIAAHVADDSFVQPQPGTAAVDHLAGGATPIALLVVAALAYPRLRGGRRAAVAVASGLFGVVAGIEGAYATIHGRTSGDDYSGLLALAAGLALVAVGIWTLWRTRRRDGTRRRIVARRALLALSFPFLAFFVVLPVGVGYVGTHVGRAAVTRLDVGASARQVSLPRRDGVTLRGTYVPSRNGAAVVALPGPAGPQAHARMLARHGYGVLLLELAGDGASQGDPNAFGWRGEADVRAAIAFLERQPDVDPRRIGGLGLSVGGEVLIQTAAHTHDLRAVVSEGAGSRSVVEEIERPGAGNWLTSSPLAAMITASTALFSSTLPPDDLEGLVARISPRPVFLIYTPNGVDSEDLNPRYYAAAREPKAIWRVPEASHTGAITARPAEYERRVIGFLDRALLGSRSTVAAATPRAARSVRHVVERGLEPAAAAEREAELAVVGVERRGDELAAGPVVAGDEAADDALRRVGRLDPQLELPADAQEAAARRVVELDVRRRHGDELARLPRPRELHHRRAAERAAPDVHERGALRVRAAVVEVERPAPRRARLVVAVPDHHRDGETRDRLVADRPPLDPPRQDARALAVGGAAATAPVDLPARADRLAVAGLERRPGEVERGHAPSPPVAIMPAGAASRENAWSTSAT
jgi:uncharacterized protein